MCVIILIYTYSSCHVSVVHRTGVKSLISGLAVRGLRCLLSHLKKDLKFVACIVCMYHIVQNFDGLLPQKILVEEKLADCLLYTANHNIIVGR